MFYLSGKFVQIHFCVPNGSRARLINEISLDKCVCLVRVIRELDSDRFIILSLVPILL